MRRRSRRIPALAPIQVCRDGACEIALLENAALGGLKLSGIRTLAAGDRVQVHVDTAVFDVEIVWAHGMSCGGRFLPDTDPDSILALLEQVQRQQSEATSATQGNGRGIKA